MYPVEACSDGRSSHWAHHPASNSMELMECPHGDTERIHICPEVGKTIPPHKPQSSRHPNLIQANVLVERGGQMEWQGRGKGLENKT